MIDPRWRGPSFPAATAAQRSGPGFLVRGKGTGLLFVGSTGLQEHHDVELQDQVGPVLAQARLEEQIAGIARLHELIAKHLEEDSDTARVTIGIETDRGPWVGALVAAGCRVCAISPLRVARYRQWRSVSGAHSDAADAHTLPG